MYATRGDRGRSRHRNRYNGSAATATAHVRVHLTAHARIKPPSVPNASTCREHEPPDDSKSMRRKHRLSMRSGPQDRRSAASVRLSGGLASTAATTRRFATMPTNWPRCCCSPSCCSYHLPPKLPDLWPERGSVDVSFIGGNKVGSRSKRCLPEVNPRCLLAGRHSSRDIFSTLPARRADLRGFARSVTRMYRLCSNASCVSHRVLTATRPRSATVSP